MSNDNKSLSKSKQGDIDAFVRKVKSMSSIKPKGRKGRLLFAMDATASREPTWDQACHIQGQMFSQTNALGGLELQLCYYRGFNEFYASAWLSDSKSLRAQMTRVRCAAGYTQIASVLQHGLKEANETALNALVFVGDCMEENQEQLFQLAGKYALHGIPIFLFQEGHDAEARETFAEIARLSRGAHCQFDLSSAQQLADLLNAVAVFAAGGQQALENFSQHHSGAVKRLTQQLSSKE